MAKRSIATVALSGSLDEKLRAIAGAGFDAVEIFENDLLTFNGSPRDVGQLCCDLVLPSARSSRFAISRACPSRSAPATSPAPNTSSTLCCNCRPICC
jgi:sugar phosphate isomerase/epimerase